VLCVSVLCGFGETQQGLKVEDESNDVGDGEEEAIFILDFSIRESFRLGVLHIETKHMQTQPVTSKWEPHMRVKKSQRASPNFKPSQT